MGYFWIKKSLKKKNKLSKRKQRLINEIGTTLVSLSVGIGIYLAKKEIIKATGITIIYGLAYIIIPFIGGLAYSLKKNKKSLK